MKSQRIIKFKRLKNKAAKWKKGITPWEAPLTGFGDVICFIHVNRGELTTPPSAPGAAGSHSPRKSVQPHRILGAADPEGGGKQVSKSQLTVLRFKTSKPKQLCPKPLFSFARKFFGFFCVPTRCRTKSVPAP